MTELHSGQKQVPLELHIDQIKVNCIVHCGCILNHIQKEKSIFYLNKYNCCRTL